MKFKISKSLSILLGVVFIFSAIAKAVSLKVFANELMLYLEIYFNGWFVNYCNQLASLICLAELIIGVCCLVPNCKKLANIIIIFCLYYCYELF